MVIGKQELQERWWRKNYKVIGRGGANIKQPCVSVIFGGERLRIQRSGQILPERKTK